MRLSPHEYALVCSWSLRDIRVKDVLALPVMQDHDHFLQGLLGSSNDWDILCSSVRYFALVTRFVGAGWFNQWLPKSLLWLGARPDAAALRPVPR